MKPKPNPKPGAKSADTPPEPVTLVKGVHRWRFQCESGGETDLLRRLSELAGQPGIPFDWFDAALVSHQLSKRLKPGLHRIDGSSTDSR